MAFGADIAELIVALRLDDKGFSGKLNNAARSLRGMDAGLSQMGRGASQLGAGMDKLVTRGAIAAVAGLTGVITTAASFEQAWAGVTKTVEGANEDLLDDFKQLSREIPLSFEELAAIGAEGGALGIATADLIDFTDVVARLAVSTDLTAEQASSSLGKIANVLHLESDALRDFGDSLVALGNDGASTESEILAMAERFGAAGKQAGLSNEAILALASTTASMGIEAEAGGGALSRIFNGITVDIATASDESKVLADSMGLSLAELRTAWDNDAGAVFGDLLEHIRELDKFEAAQFLKGLGITNTRDINALTLLAEGAEEYNRQLGVAEGQTNELNKESDAFFNTTEGKWKTFQNGVRIAADDIGGKLLPIVNDLLEDFTGWLSDPKVQRGIEQFGTDLAGGIRGVVSELKSTDWKPMLDTMKGAVDVAKTGIDLFNALPGPVKQLALASIIGNKLTGGALGDIAGGLRGIFSGALKIAFDRGGPGNPMYVVPVGGGLGGLPTTGGGSSGSRGFALRDLLKLIPAVLTAELADMLEEPSEALAQEIHDNFQLPDLPGPADWQWPLGSKNPPSWLPDFLGGPPPSPTGGRARGGDFGPVVPAPHADPRGRAVEQAIKDASSFDRVHLQRIQDEVTTLPDTAMFIGKTNEIVSATKTGDQLAKAASDADRVLLQTNANYGARTANASEITSRKRFDPKITTNVNNNIVIPVSVNAQLVAQKVYQIKQTVNSGSPELVGSI